MKEVTPVLLLILFNLFIFNILRPRRNGRHFVDDIFKCSFLNKNVLISRLRFHWSLFLRVQLTIFQHCFRKWLGTDQATSHYLIQWWLDYRRIYESLSPNELIFVLQYVWPDITNKNWIDNHKRVSCWYDPPVPWLQMPWHQNRCRTTFCVYASVSYIWRLPGVYDKQRVLMHRHQGWNVRHGLCHIYMRYLYIYIWVVYSFCLFCCLFIIVTWWYIWCIVSQVASKRKYRHVW